MPEIFCTCPWTELFLHWNKISTCCYRAMNVEDRAYTPMTPWAAWDDFSIVTESPIVQQIIREMQEGGEKCRALTRCNGRRRDATIDPTSNQLQLRKITIATTARCNVKCIYCSFWDEEIEPIEPTLDQITKLIETVNDYDGIREVWYTGGDPLAMIDAKIAKYLDVRSARTMLTTNGVGLTEARWKTFFEGRSDRCLRITVDSTDEDTYYRLKGSTSLPFVADRVRQILVNADPFNVEIGCTISSLNRPFVGDLLEYAADLEIPCVWLNSLCCGRPEMEHELFCYRAEYNDTSTLVRRLDELHGWIARAKELGIRLAYQSTLRQLEEQVRISRERDADS